MQCARVPAQDWSSSITTGLPRLGVRFSLGFLQRGVGLTVHVVVFGAPASVAKDTKRNMNTFGIFE